MSFQSFGRFLVRANMRRIKRAGRSIMKDLKKENHGRRTISNRVSNSGSVVIEKEQVGRLKSIESNLKPEPPKPPPNLLYKCGNPIPKSVAEMDPREEAYAAIGELSAVVKKIIYWTNQTEVQEVLWYAIAHEEDRYVHHILETVLGQVERTPEPKV